MEAVLEKPKIAIQTSPPKVERKVYHTTMSSNGQIFLPKELRELHDLKPGDVVSFYPGKDKSIVMTKQRSLHENLSEWRANLSPETRAIIAKTAGWTANQYHQHFDNLPANINQRKQRYGI